MLVRNCFRPGNRQSSGRWLNCHRTREARLRHTIRSPAGTAGRGEASCRTSLRPEIVVTVLDKRHVARYLYRSLKVPVGLDSLYGDATKRTRDETYSAVAIVTATDIKWTLDTTSQTVPSTLGCGIACLHGYYSGHLDKSHGIMIFPTHSWPCNCQPHSFLGQSRNGLRCCSRTRLRKGCWHYSLQCPVRCHPVFVKGFSPGV